MRLSPALTRSESRMRCLGCDAAVTAKADDVQGHVDSIEPSDSGSDNDHTKLHPTSHTLPSSYHTPLKPSRHVTTRRTRRQRDAERDEEDGTSPANLVADSSKLTSSSTVFTRLHSSRKRRRRKLGRFRSKRMRSLRLKRWVRSDPPMQGLIAAGQGKATGRVRER